MPGYADLGCHSLKLVCIKSQNYRNSVLKLWMYLNIGKGTACFK